MPEHATKPIWRMRTCANRMGLFLGLALRGRATRDNERKQRVTANTGNLQLYKIGVYIMLQFWNYKFKVAKASHRFLGEFTLYPKYFHTFEAARENAERRSWMQGASYGIMIYLEDGSLELFARFENGRLMSVNHGLKSKYGIVLY